MKLLDLLKEDHDWYVIDGQRKIVGTAANVHGAIAMADRLKKQGRQVQPISRTAYHSMQSHRVDRLEQKQRTAQNKQIEREEREFLARIPDLDWHELKELSERGSLGGLGGEVVDVHGATDFVMTTADKRVAARTYRLMMEYDRKEMGITPDPSGNDEPLTDEVKVTVYRSPVNSRHLKVKL